MSTENNDNFLNVWKVLMKIDLRSILKTRFDS